MFVSRFEIVKFSSPLSLFVSYCEQYNTVSCEKRTALRIAAISLMYLAGYNTVSCEKRTALRIVAISLMYLAGYKSG